MGKDGEEIIRECRNSPRFSTSFSHPAAWFLPKGEQRNFWRGHYVNNKFLEFKNKKIH